jgi:hypothetical protein
MIEGGTPETAAWMLYAGVVQALRWQRHAVAVAPAPAGERPRGAAASRALAIRGRT